MNTKVLSVGGSIVAPEYPDVDFVTRFVEMIKDFLSKNPDDRLILVVGGGGPARIYQKAFRDVTGTARTREPMQRTGLESWRHDSTPSS